MNEYQQAGYAQPFVPQQFAPQSLGSMFGAPLGGLIGRGIGGLFNNSGLGGRIGETAGGFLGRFSPLSADPSGGLGAQQLEQQQLQELQQQQGQLTPQGGFFGNLISTIGRPAGALIGNLTGNKTLGNIISEGSSYGRMVPFGADPQAMQGAQQQPQSPLVQLQQLQVLQQQLQQTLQQIQQQQAVLQQQLAQQGGQIAPQGWVGNAIAQYARPVGGFIGEQLGNQGLGSAIGNVAKELGRYVPFSADPYGQQQQFGGQPHPAQQYPAQQYPGQQFGGQQTVH